jgi:hypothetical protein
MQFFISSLFGIFALTSGSILAPNNDDSSLVVNNNEPSDTKTENNEDPLAPPSLLPLIDPSGGHLSLVGLDLSKPLTEAEATFLEATIRDSFNQIHEEMGIDLVADSVTVGKNATGEVDNDNVDNDASSNSNLRGTRRELERNIYGKPGPDIRPCTHHSGPLKGYGIEGCEWNIEIFLDCRCWMCLDDDFEIGVVAHRDWTPAPYYDFFRFLDDDDDYVNNKRVAKTSAAPSVAPSVAPSEAPSAAPSVAPSAAPTEEQEEDISIGLEEERGPGEPFIFLPPPSASPGPRRSYNNPIEKDVLKKLKRSKFSRFHNIKKLQFRGWP